MSTLKGLAEKIRSLENERQNLLLEIEELKKLADSKAKALESEVSMLREEVRSIKMILALGQPEEETDPKKKPRAHFFR